MPLTNEFLKLKGNSMAPEEGPVYAVHVFNDSGGEIDANVFTGATAFGDASDWLEEVKRRDRAFELWFTRMDGGQPVDVCKPLRRGNDGQWHEASE